MALIEGREGEKEEEEAERSARTALARTREAQRIMSFFLRGEGKARGKHNNRRIGLKQLRRKPLVQSISLFVLSCCVPSLASMTFFS